MRGKTLRKTPVFLEGKKCRLVGKGEIVDKKRKKCYTLIGSKARNKMKGDIISKIFKNRTAEYDKLTAYGFFEENDAFLYRKNLCGEDMTLTVKICRDGTIDADIFDNEAQDYYTLFSVPDAAGGFVGKIRAEYENVLTDIAEKCFRREVFKTSYVKDLIGYVRATYGDEPEYLWEKFPENAIWRRKDNRKWYGVILTVSRRKLGLDSDEKAEIVDLRVPTEDIEKYVDGKSVFYGYHMNKKHWISVLPQDDEDLKKICKAIDISYALAAKPKK